MRRFRRRDLALLRAAGHDVEVLDSGSCGMVGAFGFQRTKYELSVALAERVFAAGRARKPRRDRRRRRVRLPRAASPARRGSRAPPRGIARQHTGARVTTTAGPELHATRSLRSSSSRRNDRRCAVVYAVELEFNLTRCAVVYAVELEFNLTRCVWHSSRRTSTRLRLPFSIGETAPERSRTAHPIRDPLSQACATAPGS